MWHRRLVVTEGRSSPSRDRLQLRKRTGSDRLEVLAGAAEVERSPAVDQEHAHLRQSASREHPRFEESLNEPLKLLSRRQHIGSLDGDLSAPRG
jgi:hypothetical protein